MVNYNQGILKGSDQKEDFNAETDGFYHLLVITANLNLSHALGSTLENFTLNKRKINVIKAETLMEGRKVMEQNPETILVILDDHLHLNGSYTAFIDYVRGYLNNQKCFISLKGELIQAGSSKSTSGVYNDDSSAFYQARERLIEITRMILMTSEMERKISYSPVESILQDVELEFNREVIDAKAGTSWDRLYATMANDLKQPVGNIKVVLDFLTNEPDLLDQETSKDLLMRVREAADNVHELLEDFLFWNRMIKRDVQFNPVKTNLILAIRENFFLVKNLAAVKEISFAFDMPNQANVYADEYMLNTILRNLLYNAIKFTHPDHKIEISVTNENDFVKVEIKDNGSKMPPINLEELFCGQKVFSSVGAARETGTGLGLIICKDFVEKNGGEMFAGSVPGIGNTFVFKLPAC